MGSIDGEIPAVWFLISSIGFIILSIIQYRNTGKSFNTIFLSLMAIATCLYVFTLPLGIVIRYFQTFNWFWKFTEIPVNIGDKLSFEN